VRTLGCAEPVGIDSSDAPNFALTAELLQRPSTLYDPDIAVIPELASEHGRAEFVRSVAQRLAVRSGIRLNPRKLDASDRSAVRELLKVAAPICRGLSAAAPPAARSSPRRYSGAPWTCAGARRRRGRSVRK
jgi:clusterin-associated protein 1